MKKQKFKFIITTLLLIFLLVFYSILKDELKIIDTLKAIN